MKKPILLLLCVFTLLSAAAQHLPLLPNRAAAHKQRQQEDHGASSGSLKINAGGGLPGFTDPFERVSYHPVSFPYVNDEAFTEENSEMIPEMDAQAMGFSFTLDKEAYASFAAILFSSGDIVEYDGAVRFYLFDEDMNEIKSWQGYNKEMIPPGSYKLLALQYNRGRSSKLAFDVQVLNYLPVTLPVHSLAIDFNDADALVIDGVKTKLFTFDVSSQSEVQLRISGNSDIETALYNGDMEQLPVSPSAALAPGTYYLWLKNQSEVQNTAVLSILNQQIDYTPLAVPHSGNVTFNNQNLIFGQRAKAFTFTLAEPEVFTFSNTGSGRLSFVLFNGARTYSNLFSQQNTAGMLPPGTYFMWVIDESGSSGTYTASFGITKKEFYKTVALPHTADYVFSNENTQIIDGEKTLGFVFNLTQASLVEFSGTPGAGNGRLRFSLFNSLMEPAATSDPWENAPLSSNLPAGTYYLHVSCSDYWGAEDFSAVLNLRKLDYLPLAGFPFKQTVVFTEQNSILQDRNCRAMGYTFSLSTPGEFVISAGGIVYDGSLMLYDGGMNQVYPAGDSSYKLSAGTYYLLLRDCSGNIGNSMEINVSQLVYEPITLPYSQTHIYDDNTITINSQRTKLFTFTLTEKSMINMSDSEERIGFHLYDESMQRIYYYEEEFLPAGKYYLQAAAGCIGVGCEIFASTINIKVLSPAYTAVSLPYVQQHTFNADNAVEINEMLVKGFTFELQQEQALLLSSSEIYCLYMLFDGDMNALHKGASPVMHKTLGPGKYYVWAVCPAAYRELVGKDLAAALYMEPAPAINYTELTLPYTGQHTFDANTALVGGHRTKFFKFNNADGADLNLSASEFGAFFMLFDKDMVVSEGGYYAAAHRSGDYYLLVDDRFYNGAGDYSAALSVKEAVYKQVELPFEEEIVINKQMNYYTFTLDKRTEVEFSCLSADDNINYEMEVYNGWNSLNLDSSSAVMLEAGTYSIQLYFGHQDVILDRNDFAKAQISFKPVENIIYTPVALNYTRQHTFDEANTTLLGGNRTMNFKFTLADEAVLNISSTDSVYFTLFDSNMDVVRQGESLSPKVPAGVYYLRADDRYFEKSTARPYLTTTLSVEAARLSYQAVTLPYAGGYDFNDEHTILVDGLKTRGFTFTVDQTAQYMFSIYYGNGDCILFDKDMRQIADKSSQVDATLPPGKYYLQAMKRQYSNDDLVVIVFGWHPAVISAAPSLNKVIVSRTASEQDIRAALGLLTLTGTADNGQTTTLWNDPGRWTINADQTLASYEVWGGNGFVVNNAITVTVAVEKSAPALPVILSLAPSQAAISVLEGASESTVLQLLASLTITGAASNSDTPEIPNNWYDWSIASNGFSAAFRPSASITGYTYAEGLSAAVSITRTALPQIVSLTASEAGITVAYDASYDEIKAALSQLVIRGHVNNNQTIVFSNTPEAWTIASDGLSAKYEPTALFPGYTYAENLSTSVAIIRQGTGTSQDVYELAPFVYTQNRTIYITGMDAPAVEVFDISGRLLAKDKTNTVTVQTTGIYLLKVEGKMIKVIIK